MCVCVCVCVLNNGRHLLRIIFPPLTNNTMSVHCSHIMAKSIGHDNICYRLLANYFSKPSK